MKTDNISMRQVLSLLSAALLSPLILLLPGETVAVGGRAGWLSALAALPVALLVGWAFRRLLGAAPAGTGLAGALELAFGRWGGRVVTLVYLVWGLLLLGWNTRWCAFRFLATTYRNAPLKLFFFILLGVTLWIGRGKRVAFLRAAEVFALALGIALVLALGLGTLKTEWGNIAPIWIEDLPGAVWGALPVLGLLGYGVYAAFLGGHMAGRPENGRQLTRWIWGAGILLAVFQLVCIATFGPDLIERMDIPFFMMVKDVRVPGAFERVESLVMALWVLADLALLGMLFFGCRSVLEHWNGGAYREWMPWVIAGAAMAAGLWTVPDAFRLNWLMEKAVTVGNVCVGILLPVIGAIILYIKEIRRTK
ncbi:GerAB/ArcD/ProY family transporter [Clostridium sp. J1101437_171009_A5]|uniref:GerAB/ArcD/ProY family transporter n=1 Tax=Clostridium sp. J1101437_171009_A5 TaxID=2787098 RepID=UPI00189B7037|nr:GerAB/ArcD/ProY family transporter [Clostridium sp. J1101437_171009_A5]